MSNSTKKSTRKLPKKLFVEPTTRCNFSCEMCVKQTQDYKAEEGDLSIDLFRGLQPIFGQLDSVVFSGIGEPMLNPNLQEMIDLAKRSIPDSGWIGLQTNGSLINSWRLQALIEAGLTDLCLSVDAISPDLFQQLRSGGELSNISSAFEIVKKASTETDNKSFRFGIEFVVMKNNIFDLIPVLKWASENGAAFAIVSHLLPYRKSMESQCLNSPNLNVSRNLYNRYKNQCDEKGLDLNHYLKQRWRYHWNTNKNSDQKILQQLGEEMIKEGYENDIPLHLKNLINEDEAILADTQKIFEEAEELCNARGIELKLPQLFPRYERICHFVEEESVFVSSHGEIFPCFFLWHQYNIFQNGIAQKITPISFGDLKNDTPDMVWESESFSSFREKVLKYDYPYCSNCNLGPCNLFTAKAFEYDCYAIEIPCGGCPWCGGLLQCLQ